MKRVESLLAAMAIAGIVQAQGAAVDPKADAVLRALSNRNQQMQAAVFRLADTIDEVQPDGRKLQFAHIREFTVVRPDKLKVETTGDVNSRTLWIDGKTLTVLDRTENVYAQLPDPGTIDEAINLLQEKYNMSLPASDLLTTNLYESMTAACDAIDYIGIGYVGEEPCHHLAFAGGKIDWQMWIAVGDQPMLRKMVITYKNMPGEPQYTLRLLSVGDADRIPDSVFTCLIPAGAEKIEFQPVDWTASKEKEGGE